MEDEEEGGGEHESFKRLWRNERCAPALLPFDEELVRTIELQIQAQRENIEISRQTHQDKMSKVMLDAMELECDRHQFLLNSYYRCRLTKIQSMYLFLLANEEMYRTMSPAEQQFCKGFSDIMERVFQSSFLDQLPESLRRIDKEEMIIEPNLDKPVFVRVLEDIGDVQIGDDDNAEFNKGEIKVCKYRHIEHLMHDGRLELI